MLGVCLGMQLTCIEFARHVLHLDGANSAELDPNTKYPIDVYKRQILSTARHEKSRRNLGGPSPNPKYSLVTDSEPVP